MTYEKPENDDCIGVTNNWEDKYWNRESNENYKKLCEDYEKDPETQMIQRAAFPCKHPLSCKE